jgi:hypothetical protein
MASAIHRNSTKKELVRSPLKNRDGMQAANASPLGAYTSKHQIAPHEPENPANVLEWNYVGVDKMRQKSNTLVKQQIFMVPKQSRTGEEPSSVPINTHHVHKRPNQPSSSHQMAKSVNYRKPLN